MSSSPDVNVIPGRPTWQQTMIRIKDPAKSVPFYTDVLGMTLIDSFDFPQYKFSLYFVTTLPEGETYSLTPGTKEAHDYLWSMEGCAIELTHNHGTEDDESFSTYPGNAERDGFGHVAVSCDDVYAACDELEKKGVTFKKKPDEGRMKGLAFAYDPDKYWVEVVKRGATPGIIPNKFNLSQTMLRVKDPKKSIEFYKKLGMSVMRESHFSDFSLYFLASNVDKDKVPEDPSADEAKASCKDLFNPILELTHNHGTENDPDFKYFNGNDEGRQGFGHIGFLVDDVYKACDSIREMGYGFKKEPDGGSMKGLAFAHDPDGYSIEIIKRGGIEFGDEKKSPK
eukprot:CAMPEP_0197823086 /NCGR_PEP_ID=MMETSP1437-20131217/410_1 /TAXON_ID=49252 ORGANISM="Eucampia antarctica, Strain CCMP1452" /NCGR_SAMPLE_ID=MMETSP1437 /ASSEMBLY_ACC=CAM_ASM_001096 /LENGTH=338 /DNA_ID=CAMNT_0043422063 /DNA_START=207 /DNA_END=1223 /DNA_ORIENTATION=+